MWFFTDQLDTMLEGKMALDAQKSYCLELVFAASLLELSLNAQSCHPAV